MRRQYKFTTALERTTHRNGYPVDWEFDVAVVYSYLPAREAAVKMWAGEYPAGPAEVEIVAVYPHDRNIGTDLVAECLISRGDEERLIDRAHADYAERAGEPAKA